MPFISEQEHITVDLGDGKAISVKPKSRSVGAARELAKAFKEAETREKRIKVLEARVNDPELSQEEFSRIETDLAALRSKPDMTDVALEYVSKSVAEWDYYKTRADYEADKPVGLTIEALREQADADILMTVATTLIDRSNNTKDASEKKELPASLQSGSAIPNQEREDTPISMQTIS